MSADNQAEWRLALDKLADSPSYRIQREARTRSAPLHNRSHSHYPCSDQPTKRPGPSLVMTSCILIRDGRMSSVWNLRCVGTVDMSEIGINGPRARGAWTSRGLCPLRGQGVYKYDRILHVSSRVCSGPQQTRCFAHYRMCRWNAKFDRDV